MRAPGVLAAGVIAVAAGLASGHTSTAQSHALRNSIPDEGVAAAAAASAQDVTLAANRVQVALAVMSRCPDALSFEAVWARVMERANEKLNLTLLYIADENPARGEPYGVRCRHGNLECAGNVQQLCVHDVLTRPGAGERFDLSPTQAQRLAWRFVDCTNYLGQKGSIGEESLAKQCLEAVKGPSWEDDGVAECVHGSLGPRLLQQSAAEARRRGLRISATLEVEGKQVCVHDSGKWLNCSVGHEAGDFVRLIDDVYASKNPASRLASLGAEDAASTATRTSIGDSPDENTPTRKELVFQSTLQRRQQSSPAPTNTGGGGNGGFTFGPGNDPQQTPLSVFTFVIAIALFVLVVLFVLLRIFIRNRRLRALGMMPDGPLERFLGTALVREMEDSLVPPKLWEAKIVGASYGSKHAATNGSTTHLQWPQSLGGTSGVAGSGEKQQHGWDSLMPISAALPPSFYPLAAPKKQNNHQDGREGGAEGTSPESPTSDENDGNDVRGRLGLRNLRSHMPKVFQRRGRGNDAAQGDPEARGGASGGSTSGGEGNGAGASSGATAEAATSSVDAQRMPASVNITVLIAMPSERTVFPASLSNRPSQLRSTSYSSLRGPGHSRATSGGGGGGGGVVVAEKLDEAEEEGTTFSSGGVAEKGKARRAPSLRSVRSRASVRSTAEARREAFFKEETDQQAAEAGAEAANELLGQRAAAAATGEDADADSGEDDGGGRGGGYEDEEQQLPELVFGTASVPVFARAASPNAAAGTAGGSLATRSGFLSTPASQLVHPSRHQLVELVGTAREAKERRVREAREAAAAAAAKQAEEKQGPNASAGRDAPPGPDGAAATTTGGSSSVAAAQMASVDSGAAVAPSTTDVEANAAAGARRQPLGDVVTRMMATRGGGGGGGAGSVGMTEADASSTSSLSSPLSSPLAPASAAGIARGVGGASGAAAAQTTLSPPPPALRVASGAPSRDESFDTDRGAAASVRTADPLLRHSVEQPSGGQP